MSAASYLIGDVFERLAELPDDSVDLVLTSPPFLALRSYLPADHPDKAKEIGGEPTPAEFLDTLLELTAEWDRVLAPHGSICVELGDTYAGSGGAGGDYSDGGLRDGQPSGWKQANQRRDKEQMPNGRARTGRTTERKPKTMSRKVLDGDPAVATAAAPPDRLRTRRQLPGWPMDKSLCGIPHLYHLSLAYGVNILTGEPSPAGCWRVRNVVAWCRPNPPVGALGDKFRPGTSYMTIATRARDRYFDLDAVRTRNGRTDEPVTSGTRRSERVVPNGGSGRSASRDRGPGELLANNPAGAPPLDWWEIPTAPYAGSHYATFPPALCTKPIRSMCPLKVCTVCGEPSRRITGEPAYIGTDSGKPIDPASWASFAGDTRHKRTGGHTTKNDGRTETATRTAETLGWTDCGHDSWRTGVVLDPFAGSGTTLAVATGEGRDAIGIDLDERNAALALERVGMFLTISGGLRAPDAPAVRGVPAGAHSGDGSGVGAPAGLPTGDVAGPGRPQSSPSPDTSDDGPGSARPPDGSVISQSTGGAR